MELTEEDVITALIEFIQDEADAGEIEKLATEIFGGVWRQFFDSEKSAFGESMYELTPDDNYGGRFGYGEEEE